MTSSDAIKYLALGDSYTIGEAVSATASWPKQLEARLLEQGIAVSETKIIARTGWTTANLSKAIKDEKPTKDYDLVSLLIGVNNQYQGKSLEQYRTEYAALLETAIAHAGGEKAKVFVVSIPDYGYTPFGQSKQKQISRELDAFNAVCKEITESKGVSYFNITPISRDGFKDPELVAGDGLHPSGKQYGLWVDSFYKDVVKMVQAN